MTDEPQSSQDRVLEWAETMLYSVVAAILAIVGAVLVVETVITFFDHVTDDVLNAATDALSTLLLVFIFIELLSAVRTTIRERRLLAEPFLLVGIIASIKEIVVIAGAEQPADADFETFRDAMIEIGILAGIVLLLSISALLLRRREREPAEESR